MENITVYNLKNLTSNVKIDNEPSECPICHSFVKPERKYSLAEFNAENDFFRVQSVYLCPRQDCSRLFIAEYFDGDSFPIDQVFKLSRTVPIEIVAKDFSPVINKISQNFCDIFSQAGKAEQIGLTEICGVGYRKSLEFLIKDYLILELPHAKEDIIKKYLGVCINDYIDNPKIKAVAQRAVWLGNDETHYTRKWAGKDLEDLKKLIDLTIHWIEIEQLTKEVQVDMPK